MSVSGRLADAVLAALARIRHPLFWRVVYWMFSRPGVVRFAGRALERVSRRFGADAAAQAVRAISTRLVYSGWPIEPGVRGWINLDMARFVARTRYPASLSGRRRTTPRPVGRRSLRLGVVGRFSGLLSFAFEHVAAAPPEVEVHVFDIEHRSRRAEYLESAAASYTGFGPNGQEQAIAAAVNAADLDIVLLIDQTETAYGLVGLLETPCVACYGGGSNLLHHAGVDFHVYDQPEADYVVRDGRFFCGTSRSWFGPERIHEILPLYDSAGLLGGTVTPWREREPLVVFHGSLYKLAAPPFLEALMGLVAEQGDLDLAYMGQSYQGEQERIAAAALNWGVASRVHYEGSYLRTRVGPREVEGQEGWSHVCDLLRRARLAPNPWPIGGGSSRVEAYLLGAPVVSMRLLTDPASWGRPQHTLAEPAALEIPEASATTIPGYIDVARRCLRDEQFADGVAARQLEVAAAVVDGGAFWRRMVDAYERWRLETGVD